MAAKRKPTKKGSVPRSKEPDMHLAVMGVDPGMSTGVAWATGPVSKGRRTGWSEWWEGAHRGSTTLVVGSTEPSDLHKLTMQWMRDCVLPLWEQCSAFMLIVEGFTLGQRQVSRSPEILSPVKIGAVFQHEFYSMAVAQDVDAKVVAGEDAGAQIWPVLWGMRTYSAGVSKGAVNDARLKAYGAWVRGRDHERDAYRLVITGLKKEWAVIV